MLSFIAQSLSCALVWYVIMGSLAFIAVFATCYFLIPHPPKFDIRGAHILVTGGSKGIGRAIAEEALMNGANVTIVARDSIQLDKAKNELLGKLAPSSRLRVEWFSLDLIKATQKDMESVVYQAETRIGRPVDILVNNAGGSVEAPFDELTVEDFDRQIRFNVLSAVGMTQSVLAGMKQRRNGRLVYISSMAGQIGLFGYTTYSAAKFALRGLVETLQMEVQPHNVWCTMVFPPNTNTEGFAREMEDMPLETRLISEDAGLWDPAVIARKVLKDVCQGRFYCWFGVDGWMLARLTCGASYVTSTLACVEQVFLMGILRFVGLFYIKKFDGIVAKCHKDRKEKRL